jgi:hypothetical protein
MNKRGKPMLNCDGDSVFESIREDFSKKFKNKNHIKHAHINLIKKYIKKS